MKPKNIKQLHVQSKQLAVRRVGKNAFVVQSQSDPHTRHTVTIRHLGAGQIAAGCNCEWAEHQGVACSHVIAVLGWLAARRGRKLSFWLNAQDAERQKHRTLHLVDSSGTQNGVWITSRSA